MKIQIISKSIYNSMLLLLIPFMVNGQATMSKVDEAAAPIHYDKNGILLVIVLFMLIPIIIFGSVFKKLVVSKYTEKYTNFSSTNKILSILLFVFISGNLSAQTTARAFFNRFESFDAVTWIYFFIFILELIILIFFGVQINSLLKPKMNTSWIEDHGPSLWQKILALRPLKDEDKIDTGHNYDGIRELDNVIPPWFTAAFIATIIFAAIYWYRYQVAFSAPSPLQEYNMAMDEASKIQNERLATMGADVDENTITMLDQSEIAKGKETFAALCSPCHQAHGGSMPGGVGPNLTDDYWIHGGSLKDIFTSIKYGWPEKGMISWKSQLSANKMAQITSFIKSIKGSNPANAKEAQGELFKEQANVVSTSASQDTLKK